MSQSQHKFQAETSELLSLMIHSLYSQKEIFLRELISNASDAIDKLRIESLTNTGFAASEPSIKITPNAEKNTLTISDNGIGMSEKEVQENIGTIAHSGTKAFLKNRNEISENPELIGQFGVGFYSAFMVANKIRLHTQRADEKIGTVWESDGKDGYSIRSEARPEGTGTTIELELKDKKELDEDYTDSFLLQSIIKKYSDFIAHPIFLPVETTTGEGENKKTEIKEEIINSQKALWLRSPHAIKDEEYKEFYKHVTHDWSDPLKTIHFKAEGTIEFASVVFIPSAKPWNYDYRDTKHGLSLYVKRVFIMENCEELIPPFLRFVKGMVDSNDLSLNVSREILQKDRQVVQIQRSVTGKVLGQLEEMKTKERENYEKFWSEFGSTLKEGIPAQSVSQAHQDKLKSLLLFRSSRSDGWVSLGEYIERMKPGQKSIYYMTGDSAEQIQNSPYLEKFKDKDIEVLFWIDPIDEWLSAALKEFDNKKLDSITQENLDLGEVENDKSEVEKTKQKETFAPLIDKMKNVLSGKVKDVRISDRLTDSPVCLVSGTDGPSAHMERLLEAMGKGMPAKTSRVLEINSNHAVFKQMLNVPETKQQLWTEILYSQALLNEGTMIENPQKLSQQIADLMISSSMQS